MAFLDIRQLVAGILTFSMFIMLGNMIKKDHFGSAIVDDVSLVNSGSNITTTNHHVDKDVNSNAGPWKPLVETLKPCWNRPAQEIWNQPKGYIIFSLTGSRHRHFSQVANAVVIARQVKATLVLPVIVGNKAGKKRDFGDVYDVHKFVASLNGIVEIAYHQPPELSAKKLHIVRVPNLVSEDYITAELEPLFKREGNLKLVTFFPDTNMNTVEGMKYMNSVSCMMFEALQLRAGLQELIDSVLQTLKSSSRASNGRFIAVDLRTKMLGTKRCQVTAANEKKSCFSAMEVGQFLRKIGFESNTTIYLTEIGWHKSLHALTDIFPNTFTKDKLIPSDKMKKLSDFIDVIDYYICSQSDVFVPAISRPFYASVVGERIALGKTQILDPSQATSSDMEDYISSYVTGKNHWAYMCFC